MSTRGQTREGQVGRERPSRTATNTNGSLKATMGQDAHGQPLPFSRDQFAAAWQAGTPVAGANRNDVRRTTIGGREYIAKVARDDQERRTGQSAYDQQRNEAAAPAALRALGLESVAPAASYHVVGSDGRQYAVTTLEHGDGENFSGQRRLNQVAGETHYRELAKAWLADYVLGMDDSHANNMLFDATTGSVKHIDFGFSFRQGLSPSSRSWSGQALSRRNADDAQVRGTANRHQKDMRDLVTSMAKRADAFAQTLQRFGLSHAEVGAARARLTYLVDMAKRNQDLSPEGVRRALGQQGQSVEFVTDAYSND